MRITEQYFWNLIFLAFFLVLLFMGTVILNTEAYKPWSSLTLTDYSLISLASFRLIRLVQRDIITAFFREQFYDAEVLKNKVVLTKPPHGPRRTMVELVTCPWCLGLWNVAFVTFFYVLTPYAFFPVIILALGGVATFLQLIANLIGWKAEQAKIEVESR